MLKFQYAVVCALASVVALPAITAQGGGPSLARRLDETVRALEMLAGFQTDRPVLDDAIQFVKVATEEPILDGPERDARLVSLRDAVNRLAQDLDRVAPGAHRVVQADATSLTTGLTTGLSSVDQRALAVAPLVAEHAPALPAVPADEVELGRFSADPALEARAYFRAARYAECVKLAEIHSTQAQVLYWSACALERLAREDEALARFRAVADAPGAGPIAERARQDVEHIEWKRSFRARRAASKSSGGEQP